MELLEHQAEFIESNFIHTGIVGGYRSGKSQAGVIKTVIKKLAYPGIDVAYYLPTYGLIKDIAYPKFKEFLTYYGIRYTLNKSDHEFLTPFGRIILRSMDNPDSIIGYEVGYSLVDEADILPTPHMNDAFSRIVSRLSVPLPDGSDNCLDFVSTPEGFKFLYEFFEKKKHPNKLLIRAKTENNPFISKSYIDTLKMSYTKEQLKAYLNGEFCNFTAGSVYKSFERNLHGTTIEALPGEDLYIGMDFNIEKMSAIIHVIRHGAMYAVKEVLKKYDTEDLARSVRELYPNNKIEINPDASCRQRSSSGLSDYDILIEDKYDFEVNVRRKNPEVSHRIRAVNKAFESGKLFVNLAECPEYANALEQQAYKKGLPDKDSGLDHSLDAGGYCVVEQIYNSGLD